MARVQTRVVSTPAKPPSPSPGYRVVNTRTVDYVPYVVAGPFRQVGRSASIRSLMLMLYVTLSVLSLVLVALPAGIGRRWWELSRLLDTGSGDLRPETVSYS